MKDDDDDFEDWLIAREECIGMEEIADEMFKKLGYKRKVYQKTDELFLLIYDRDGKEIHFDKLREEVSSLSGIDTQELKAINKKVEELGWNE